MVTRMWNLPDDFSWREFDRHFGDDEPEEEEEPDLEDVDLIKPIDEARQFWRDGFDERTQQ